MNPDMHELFERNKHLEVRYHTLHHAGRIQASKLTKDLEQKQLDIVSLSSVGNAFHATEHDRKLGSGDV